MHVVDAHIHLWARTPAWRGYEDTPPEAYGTIIMDGREVQMLPPSFVESVSTPEIAIGYMDRFGVARAIVVQETLDGFLNEVVSDAVRRYPDRLVGEALPDPRKGSDSVAGLEQVFSQGVLRGMKIPLQGLRQLAPDFDVDGELASAWFEVCRQAGAFVTIHGREPATFARPMRAAAERFPEVTFIIAHLGFPNRPHWEDTLAIGKLPNVYLELAGIPFLFKERYPCPRSAEVIQQAAEAVGVEKLLWGSDYPRTLCDLTYTQQIEVVSVCCDGLSEEERELILGGNAERVLGGTAAPS